MLTTILEFLILLAVLVDVGISIWDRIDQKAFQDEEIEVLQQIADALNPEEIEVEEK